MKAGTSASALYLRLNNKTQYALMGRAIHQHEFHLLSRIEEVLCRLQ